MRDVKLSSIGDVSLLAKPPASSPAAVEEAASTYLRALRRSWPVVLGSVILAVAIALVTISRAGSTYEATASVLVSPLGGADPTFAGTGVVMDTGDPTRTVQTAAALLDSPRAAALTAAAMRGGWTERAVRATVTVAPRGQSNLLGVTARAATAAEASRLANTFASTAVVWRSKVVLRNIDVKLRALEVRFKALGGGTAAGVGRDELAARIAQLEALRATGADPTLRVAQAASLPTSPTGLPMWFLVLLSAIVGFALGSIGAVALAYFSPRIGDETEVGLLLPVPVLGAVPKVTLMERRQGLGPVAMPPFVFEQIRKVRAQIPSGDGPSVLMVTSADVGDGKTTIAAGLAAAFAEGNEEVILLDLDLRRPRVAKLFGLAPSARRSAEFQAGSLERMLVPVPSLPNVRVLSIRAANISVLERLISQLPEVLDEARQLASWVVLDTPPLGEVSDGLRFASSCDAVLLVVRAGRTDRSRLILAYNQLARVGARILGTVVNDQRRFASRASYADQYHGVGWEIQAPASTIGGRWAAPARSSRSSAHHSQSD